MLSGSDLSKYFDQKSNKAYSSFLDTTKKTRLFKDAYTRLVEERYANLATQKNYDELSSVIVTDGTFSINNNKIYTTNLVISGVTAISATVLEVTTRLTHNMSTGDTFTISGVSGTGNLVTYANATGTVTSTPTTTTFRFTVISSTGTYTTNTGVLTNPKLISDYLHLLAVKCKFSQLRSPAPTGTSEFTDATNTTPIVLTFSTKNNLRSGQLLTISNVGGNTNANGTYYIKKLNSKKISLYYDVKLTSEVQGNGTYTSGGITTIVTYNYARPYISDRKISSYGEPNVDYPRYETDRNQLKFTPLTETCSEITIDYIKTYPYIFDLTDTVVDLSLYWNEKFLFSWIDRAVIIFTTMVKDGELYKLETNEIQLNS